MPLNDQASTTCVQVACAHNPKPWVVVRNPGQDDEDIVDDFSNPAHARRFMKSNPGTDLMKRLENGQLTTEF